MVAGAQQRSRSRRYLPPQLAGRDRAQLRTHERGVDPRHCSLARFEVRHRQDLLE